MVAENGIAPSLAHADHSLTELDAFSVRTAQPLGDEVVVFDVASAAGGGKCALAGGGVTQVRMPRHAKDVHKKVRVVRHVCVCVLVRDAPPTATLPLSCCFCRAKGSWTRPVRLLLAARHADALDDSQDEGSYVVVRSVPRSQHAVCMQRRIHSAHNGRASAVINTGTHSPLPLISLRYLPTTYS